MAELRDRDRKKLKDSGPAEPDQRTYPIENESHARSALSRVSANGSEEEQGAVRGKVEKYPDLKQD